MYTNPICSKKIDLLEVVSFIVKTILKRLLLSLVKDKD